MPNSQDLNVLSICAELLESMDAGAAQRITQFLHSKFSTGLSEESSLIQPKKRGRPAMKKRGRPAKVAIPASSLNGSTIEKKKRGRPAKKKRGRPAKTISLDTSTVGESLDATPIEKKKRGRPAKKKRGRPAKIVTPSVSLDATPIEKNRRGRPAKKKRGRPAKITLDIIPSVKRRGRPAKKKRGRPANVSSASPIISSNDSIKSENSGRRGRPRKS